MYSMFLKKCLRMISAFAVMVLLSLPSGVITAYAASTTTTRVSVDSSGAQANAASRNVAISLDGRFVVFESDASNLIIGDANNTDDVFVRNMQTGEVTRVSVDSSGLEANGGSGDPAISGDGRFIAFTSVATNLVSGDTNNATDVFVHDRVTGATTRASVSTNGEQGNAYTESSLSLSSDGRFVVFNSDATNLVSNDTNGLGDIFLHDNQTGSTELISLASDGLQANGSSFDAQISANGLLVVFVSGATNLISADINNKHDVFVRDRQSGVTTLASVNSSGVAADGNSTEASISADGRFVAFSSSANNLMSQDTYGFDYIYVHDRQSGSTVLASISFSGDPLIGWSEYPSLSADGRYVAFEFDDKGDGLAFRTIYFHDLLTNETISIPHIAGGGETNSSYQPSISGDGRFVAYQSPANSLVSDDTNEVSDAFVGEINHSFDANPTVISIQRSTCCATDEPVAEFIVNFSEAVTGVDVSDFNLTTSGIMGASVLSVTPSDSGYIVQVNTGSGEGFLRLTVIDNDSITDSSLNPLGGVGWGNGNFETADAYKVDKSAPQPTSILRADPSPSSSDYIRFNIDFSEPVIGVDISDFALTTSGIITDANVVEVRGSETSYLVTVFSGSGDGSLRLDIIDNDSITDSVGRPLGGEGIGNANFTTGESYIIDKNVPLVTSILRADSNPATTTSLHYNVSFSEAVSGVDGSDFVLTSSGIPGASITSVSGSGSLYNVVIAVGSGNGTLRLDLMDNDSVIDSIGHSLGGAGIGNANFTGETYTVNTIPVSYLTTTFRSNGTNDGWVLESTENSNVGGSANSTAATFKLGDNAQDAQYRSILHFPTYYLPDNAVVTRVILTIKKQSMNGADPFTTHQNILIDIYSGIFGMDNLYGAFSLQPGDFQAPSTLNAIGVIQNNPVNGVYWSMLDANANRFINLTGMTQFRIFFQLDDNDDMSEDTISFFSGDTPLLLDRPHLQVEYYVPR